MKLTLKEFLKLSEVAREEGEIRKGDKVTITYKKHPNCGESGMVTRVDDTGEELTIKLANGKTVQAGCDDVDVEGLNESYHLGGGVNHEEDEDGEYTNVEVVDSRGEDIGHFTVHFRDGKEPEVISNPGNPTESQKKQIIAVAKKALKESLTEGTWALAKSTADKAKLKKLLSKPLLAKDATKALYDLVGNDDLFDAIDETLTKDGPNVDVSDMVKGWIQRNIPDLLK